MTGLSAPASSDRDAASTFCVTGPDMPHEVVTARYPRNTLVKEEGGGWGKTSETEKSDNQQ